MLNIVNTKRKLLPNMSPMGERFSFYLGKQKKLIILKAIQSNRFPITILKQNADISSDDIVTFSMFV